MAGPGEPREDDATRHRRFQPYLWTLGAGGGIGLLYAVIVRPDGAVTLTDSWSYVPAEDWWLHAVVVGVTLCLVYVGMVIAWKLIGVLVQRGLLFTAVGVFLIVTALFLFGRAALGDETTGGRVAWVVMGLLVGGVGVPMAFAERDASRPGTERRRRS